MEQDGLAQGVGEVLVSIQELVVAAGVTVDKGILLLSNTVTTFGSLAQLVSSTFLIKMRSWVRISQDPHYQVRSLRFQGALRSSFFILLRIL